MRRVLLIALWRCLSNESPEALTSKIPALVQSCSVIQPSLLTRCALSFQDEVQTGCSRTGKELASWWDDAKPDMVVLGKALSGGTVSIHRLHNKRTNTQFFMILLAASAQLAAALGITFHDACTRHLCHVDHYVDDV